MTKKNWSIAIDGPSGAGKSTLARMVAERYHFIYVDTGAIYRSVGLFALENGVDSKDEAGVTGLLQEIGLELRHDKKGVQQMYLCGRNVSKEIRLPEVSIYASDVSAMPAVRAYLLEMQREMAARHSVIMDGRDIGTVVLPQADLKIFLTAMPEERARRRYDELMERGTICQFDEVLRDILYRDENDSKRALAPLKPAEDAVIVDTTGNTLRKSFDVICGIIKERLGL